MTEINKSMVLEIKCLAEKVGKRVEELEQEVEDLKYENDSFREAIKILLADPLSPADEIEVEKLLKLYYGEQLPNMLRDLIVKNGFDPYDILPMLKGELKKVG